MEYNDPMTQALNSKPDILPEPTGNPAPSDPLKTAIETLKGPKHKIVELTYSKGVTIQMRDYEPCNIHISAKAELTQDTPENRNIALQDMEKFVKDELVNEQTILLAQRKQLMEMTQKKRTGEQAPQTDWPDTTPEEAVTPQPEGTTTDDLMYFDDNGQRDAYAEIRMEEAPF